MTQQKENRTQTIIQCRTKVDKINIIQQIVQDYNKTTIINDTDNTSEWCTPPNWRKVTQTLSLGTLNVPCHPSGNCQTKGVGSKTIPPALCGQSTLTWPGWLQKNIPSIPSDYSPSCSDPPKRIWNTQKLMHHKYPGVPNHTHHITRESLDLQTERQSPWSSSWLILMHDLDPDFTSIVRIPTPGLCPRLPPLDRK